MQDVLSKLSLLFDHYSASQTRLNSHLSTIRLHFKSIRTREEGLADLKARKRALASKIESVEKKLAKMGPENKELMKTTTLLKDHRSEMESLRIEVMTEEAAIGDFKRRTTKEAMGLRCGGLLEFAEKITVSASPHSVKGSSSAGVACSPSPIALSSRAVTSLAQIVAEIGKMIIDQIPLEPTKPGMPRADYNGHNRTEQLLQEATRCISDVGFVPSGSAEQTSRPDFSHLESGYPGEENYDSSGFRDDRAPGGTDGDDGYPSAASYQRGEAGDHSNTPIYATHQTTQRWLQDQSKASHASLPQDQAGHNLNTDGIRDQAADDWGKAADATTQEPAEGDVSQAYEHPQQSNAAHDQLPATSAANVSRPASPPRIVTPPPEEQPAAPQPGSPTGAPSLPPLRAASPLPGGAGGAAAADDDESYFAAVGSTRAAQAAARRPHSPGGGASRRYSSLQTGSVSSLGAFGGAAPSAAYEPAESGRKMTAAAFRKGFNRAPSAQHLGGSGFNPASPSSEAPPPTMVPSRENTASPSVPPLSIRKRHSAVPDADVAEHEAVPPYAAGPNAETQPSAGYQAYDQQQQYPASYQQQQQQQHGYLPQPPTGAHQGGSGYAPPVYMGGGDGTSSNVATPPVPGGYDRSHSYNTAGGSGYQ